MNDPNLRLLEQATDLLAPLLDELVFVGGCVTGLLITDPAAAQIRPTQDVDVIAEIASYAEYETLSLRLKALGLTEDTSDGAPVCRWRTPELFLDVMPTDAHILGFTNRWYKPAMRFASRMRVGQSDIRVVSAVHFLAMKIEAFRGRGEQDYAGSHDLEDLIAVIDGRAEITEELRSAPSDARRFVASAIAGLLGTRSFADALPGFLLPDSPSQARLPLLRRRLAAISGLSG